ncbi:MAG TPA: hypothetical protein VG934_00245 [Candidatus Paceibacterota bacterium]|nr:hypothetical protein [Candidatus Paceibacterota bacterium]
MHKTFLIAAAFAAVVPTGRAPLADQMIDARGAVLQCTSPEAKDAYASYLGEVSATLQIPIDQLDVSGPYGAVTLAAFNQMQAQLKAPGTCSRTFPQGLIG